MNIEEFRVWQDDVCKHCKFRDTLVNDRKILKKQLVSHLSQFFTFDEDDIEWDFDFNRIKIRFKKNVGAVIKSDNMVNLHMDWIVVPDYDDGANRIIRIDVYPFGLPEEGVVFED